MWYILFRYSITVKTTFPSLCFVFVHIIHIWPPQSRCSKKCFLSWSLNCVFVYFCFLLKFVYFLLLRFARWARRLFMCTSSFTARSFFQLGHGVAVLYPHNSGSKPWICFTNCKYIRNFTFSDTSWPGVLFCSCPRILRHHGSGNFCCFVLVFELLSWFRWKCEWYGPWLPNMKAWQCNIDILPKPWYLRSTLNWQCKKEIHPPEIF